MVRCAVIDLETNTQVNFIIAEVTDTPPIGCKLVEIPDGDYWNQYVGKLLPQTHYWDGTQAQIRPEGYYWSQAAGQLILDTQYWDGNKIQEIPDGYYWNNTKLKLMSIT